MESEIRINPNTELQSSYIGVGRYFIPQITIFLATSNSNLDICKNTLPPQEHNQIPPTNTPIPLIKHFFFSLNPLPPGPVLPWSSMGTLTTCHPHSSSTNYLPPMKDNQLESARNDNSNTTIQIVGSTSGQPRNLIPWLSALAALAEDLVQFLDPTHRSSQSQRNQMPSSNFGGHQAYIWYTYINACRTHKT